MNFQNKTVVITGASKGIGASCAKLFFDSGANVALLDLSYDTNFETRDRWLAMICDVSSEIEVKEALEKVNQHFGSIDLLNLDS